MNKNIITFVLYLAMIFIASSNRIIPNVEYITLGYNMQIGQLDDIRTIKNQVFNVLTYKEHQTTNLNGSTYLQPDQLNVFDFPTEERTSTNEVYTSTMILQESLAMSYSANYNPWFYPGMFSSSSDANYFHELFEEDFEYMATSYLRVTSYRAKLNDKIKLDSFFERQLNNLPTVYNQTTCQTFKRFFDTFGTHYVYDCIFGGVVKMTTSFSMELLQDTTIANIEKDLNTQFFLLTTSETLTEEQEEELTNLNMYYKSTFKLIGGDPSEFNITQYQQWTKTVFSDPLIINMEIYNFTTLLKNKQKINALNKAMTEYFYSTYSDFQEINVVPYSLTSDFISLVYVLVDNTVYFPISTTYNQGYYYNLETNLWNQMTPIFYSNTGIIANYKPICSSVQDNIYCFVADVSNSYQHVYTFNTNNGLWTTLPNLDSLYLRYGSSVTIGTMIYILGSSVSCVPWPNIIYPSYAVIMPNPIYVYDTFDNTLHELYGTNELLDYSPVNIGNLIYTFGGFSMYVYEASHNDFYHVMSNKTFKFDTISNAWSELEQMPIRLYSPGIVVIDTKIYVMGGSVVDEYLPFDQEINYQPNYDILMYDTIDNKWNIYNNNSIITSTLGIAFSDKGFIYYMTNKINMFAPNNFC
ncbi:membrane-attack complex/perforin MACPF family protein [Hokovirus HKV1]|uniref:Membrane-attack complex/perforin MACPF family protein n=1 Tax=Hokovirus HKV1 TaxID=1977638 RepID=A0A1V0SF50_9VIRU|nr:membrane-attack complex/perforin MACPF family protein [Hokovirus HKV1]